MALPDPDATALLDALVGLHPAPDAGEDLRPLLGRIAEAVHDAVPASASATITVPTSGRFRTDALAGAPALPVDDAQYVAGDGPCLRAYLDDARVEVADIATDVRWPAFREAALAAGFCSSLSLPLSTGRWRIGSLNLYASGGVIDGAQADAAVLLAREASIAAANVVARHDLERSLAQLSEALESRDVLGQAKGILMAQQRIGAADAFGEMVTVSQQTNRKVRDVARWVVETGTLDGFAADGGRPPQ